MDPIQVMRWYGIRPDGIVHVGANVGQERYIYKSAGVRCVLYIEPIEEMFHELRLNIRDLEGHFAVKAVCSNRDGDTVRFNIANNMGQSSSLFDLGPHAHIYPSIVYTRHEEMVTQTLDTIVATGFPRAPFNYLVIDVQGAELKVLQGSRSLLDKLDALYVEVSEDPLYDGSCTLDEVSAFLGSSGFRLKWLEMSHLGWGNAFYVHNRVSAEVLLPDIGPNIALNKPAKQSSIYTMVANHEPQGAVSGVISGRFGFHTDLEDCPWWQIDLLETYDIKEIRIYNRGDGWQERAFNLIVLLSLDELSWRAIHDQDGWPFGHSPNKQIALRIPLNIEKARFVRIQLKDRQYLHLDQVEVY
jgi:FkbM family methyltransferase